ncbi:MAG: putative endonuclease [Frankiales bacterium]|nr:putative endonuclease [Frankiales bacterium]MDX6273283.1 putative endonuclease [Frankiales bacterium]
MRAKDALGKYGEQLAAEHLEAAGLVLIQRNWRCRDGELDIVARDGDVLVVCEVKARSSTAFGTPAEAVDWRKAARLRRLAAMWLQESSERFESIRFDIVAVLRTPDGTHQVDHLVGVL